jgi:hypothetical protein
VYEDQSEIDIILTKHKNKLYTFVALVDADDREIRNRIIIALVRIAQKGNILAQAELIKWIRYIVDDWVEKYYQLFKWRGYGDEIDEKIKGCIRGYKYTGSFVGYLFKTLEYSARGMRSLQPWSLDDPIGDDGSTKVDFISVDQDTNIATIFGR